MNHLIERVSDALMRHAYPQPQIEQDREDHIIYRWAMDGLPSVEVEIMPNGMIDGWVGTEKEDMVLDVLEESTVVGWVLGTLDGLYGISPATALSALDDYMRQTAGVEMYWDSESLTIVPRPLPWRAPQATTFKTLSPGFGLMSLAA